MFLVYLVTSLPLLRLGEPPPLTKEEFQRRARAHLTGPEREEFERLMLLEELEETVRLMSEAKAENPLVSSDELTGIVRTRRRQTADGPRPEELPDWVTMALPEHVLYRRFFQHLYERAQSPFLKEWARFSVDLKETLTGLLSARAGLQRAQSLEKMEGRFDSTSSIIVTRYDVPDLGISQRFSWYPRVQAALELDDLMAMERELDRLHWETIEALKGTDLFTIDYVLATYLQLRILVREASWNQARGEEILERLLTLEEPNARGALA